MDSLLKLSRIIDALSEQIGKYVPWLVLVVVLVGAVNGVMRYAFNFTSNSFFEIQWYLFGMIFFLCGGFTFLRNEHVRIDLLSNTLSRRTQAWVEIFGILFFLMPMALICIYLSWPVFMYAFESGEMSNSAGGLILWPARLMGPVGFSLLVLQALSELIKQAAFLSGAIEDPMLKNKKQDSVVCLADMIKAERQQGEK